MSELSLVDWGDSISLYKGDTKLLLTNEEIHQLKKYIDSRRTEWMLTKLMKMEAEE